IQELPGLFDPCFKSDSVVDEDVGAAQPGQVPGGGFEIVGFHSRRDEEDDIHVFSADLFGKIGEGIHAGVNHQSAAGIFLRFSGAARSCENHDEQLGNQ